MKFLVELLLDIALNMKSVEAKIMVQNMRFIVIHFPQKYSWLYFDDSEALI